MKFSRLYLKQLAIIRLREVVQHEEVATKYFSSTQLKALFTHLTQYVFVIAILVLLQ